MRTGAVTPTDVEELQHGSAESGEVHGPLQSVGPAEAGEGRTSRP